MARRGAIRLILLLVLCVAAGVGVARTELPSGLRIPVKEVVITGELKYMADAELQQTLRLLAEDGFVAMNLAELKAEIEALAWVRHAAVRRVWPALSRYRGATTPGALE